MLCSGHPAVGQWGRPATEVCAHTHSHAYFFRHTCTHTYLLMDTCAHTMCSLHVHSLVCTHTHSLCISTHTHSFLHLHSDTLIFLHTMVSHTCALLHAHSHSLVCAHTLRSHVCSSLPCIPLLPPEAMYAHSLEQGLPAGHPWHLGQIILLWDHAGLCRIQPHPGLYLQMPGPPVVTTKNVSRHCQHSPVKNHWSRRIV